jgi:4-amino-4-deoxy-L-arabinose transferase-like glycosyltransferase
MMESFRFVVGHYALALLVSVVAFGLGGVLTRGMVFHSLWEELGVRLGIGVGTLAGLVFALGLLGLLTPVAVLVLIAAILIPGYPTCRHFAQRLLGEFSGQKLLKSSAVVFVAIALASVLLALPLYPPTAWDSTSYHLAAAKAYAQNHGLVYTPYLRYPVFPQLNEMLLCLGLLLCDDVLAQILQGVLLATLTLVTVGFARRHFSRRAGWWAAAALLGNPIVLWLGSCGYVDIGVALWSMLAVVGIWNWLDTREKPWLVWGGICGGFAMGTKYSALYVLAVLLLALMISARTRRDRAACLVWVTLVIVVAAPWMVRSFVYTGNPFWPALSSVFGNSIWTNADIKEQMQDLFVAHGVSRSLGNLVKLPWLLTFRQTVFIREAALSRTYFWMLPVALVVAIWDYRVRRLVLFTSVSVMGWFFSSQILRYLVPILPVFGVVCAGAIDRALEWPAWLRRWTNRNAITFLGCVALIWPGLEYATTILRHRPLPVSPAQRDAYLAEKLLSYPAYRYLNAALGTNYCLYALYSENMAYFADGTVMGDWFGIARYADVLDKLASGERLYHHLRKLGSTHLLLNTQRHSVDLPQDDFFHSHFKLVFACPYTRLFELSELQWRREFGPELLRNPGFEELQDNRLQAWTTVGTPVVDHSGTQSHGGRVAVSCEGGSNAWFQTVSVTAGGLYTLSLHARTAHPPQQTRLQVNWQDTKGTFLRADIEVRDVGDTWRQYEMPVIAPAGAVAATVYASPHGASSVWYDDLSFAQVSLRVPKGNL